MPLKIAYLLMRCLFGPVALVLDGDQAKDAELLVLRHENAVLRRTAGRVRYESANRAWFAALTPFIPRRQWARIFPVTPATLLGLAPETGRAEVRHEHARQARTAEGGPEYRPDRRLPGEGEPTMGLPADPRRADQARHDRCAVDRP